MYIEKVLELANPTHSATQAPSSEEIAAQQARRSRAWEVGQTIFAPAKEDEAYWQGFTSEESESFASSRAAGILALLPDSKATNEVTYSPWVDYGADAEVQAAMTRQHVAAYGLRRLFGSRSWNNVWFDLNIRSQGIDESKVITYANITAGYILLPALKALHFPRGERATAETEAIQALEVLAGSLKAGK